MKAVSKELVKESSNVDQVPVDPFAVDVFARDQNVGAPAAVRSVSQRGDQPPRVNRAWNARLPRVTANVLEASAALTHLRPETYAQINNSVISVLSRYSMTPAEQITVSLVDLQEKDFHPEAVAHDERLGVVASFTLGPQATVSIDLDVPFAARLVDRMLGGDGASPEQLRSLTTTERAVIEFLYLSSVSELNQQSGEPLVRLQSIHDRPLWTNKSGGLLASLRIGVGDITGIGRVYLNRESLSALDEAARRHPESSLQELPRYTNVVSDLGLNVLIGKTDVAPHELLSLEAGDVMVVETPAIRWREQRISGSLFLRVADGDDAWIIGELSERGEAELEFKVSAISTTPPSRFTERLKMQEDTQNVEAPDEGVSLIEAAMVSVRVELAARRLSLDELSRLRKNQILELGCNATDPVDLVVDGRRVAVGELVDIEGRLGVRVTKVLS